MEQFLYPDGFRRSHPARGEQTGTIRDVSSRPRATTKTIDFLTATCSDARMAHRSLPPSRRGTRIAAPRLRRIASTLLLLVTLPACGDSEQAPAGLLADEIAVAHTPPGGYGDAFPEPILAACTEPLVEGAPDLRGMWKSVDVTVGGEPAPPDHRARRHFQRVEQCGDRVVITGNGVIHDMRCDGTVENGVDDVAERDLTTRLRVVATYEDGVHVLRPVGISGIEVRRRRDGDQMVFDYVGGVTIRLERTGPPESATPPLD